MENPVLPARHLAIPVPAPSCRGCGQIVEFTNLTDYSTSMVEIHLLNVEKPVEKVERSAVFSLQPVICGPKRGFYPLYRAFL